MNINYFKTGIFVTAAIALLSACNTTPATQPNTVATTTPTSAPTATPTASPPDLLSSQKAKAIESSARLYLGSLSRAQQAYFLEKSKFSSNIDDLGVGIKAEDSNYLLQIVDTQPKSVTMTATAKQDNVKSFAASVFEVGNAGKGLTGFIVCATDIPSKTPPTGITVPKTEKDAPTCPTGSLSVDIRKPS
jgi:type II secretory pathway pseudopilin PulG